MFYFDDFYGKKILKSTLLADYDCFFTTREFVLTPSNRTDLEKQAEENREFLLKNIGANSFIRAKQTHSCNIKQAKNKDDFFDDTDALISDIENSVMILNFADCVPIILYSKKDNIGAIAHAGWRGTASEIAAKTVKEMKVKPENLTALIGPAIGKCCFETGEDVFEQIIKDKSRTDLYEKRGEKYFIDLKLINYNQLSQMGVKDIDICSYCTCCMSDIFFSYRKEKGITARHSAIVKIKRG